MDGLPLNFIPAVSAGATPRQTLAEMSRREGVLVVLGLSAMVVLQALLAGVHDLFLGPLRLDEYLTHLIVLDPSVVHSVAAIRGGVDTNPPVYHLILRGFFAILEPVTRASPEVIFRFFSLLWVLIGLIACYATLRRTFSTAACAIATLLVWAEPVVVMNAFSARFYGLFFGSAAIVCWTLGWTTHSKGLRICRIVLLGVASALLCTVHYFGILSLGSIALAVLIFGHDSMRQRLARCAPMLAGPIALLPFLSYISTQRAGLRVATWVNPISTGELWEFVRAIWSPLPLAAVILIWFAALIFGDRSNKSQAIHALRQHAAMLGLLAVPIIIILFSVAVQSALMSRYAIASSLALAPLTAVLVQHTRRSATTVLAVLLPFASARLVRVYANESRQLGSDQTALLASLHSGDPGLPIVFANRGPAYLTAAAAPDLAPRIVIGELPKDFPDQGRPFYRYEWDMTRKVRAFYDTPPLADAQSLRGMRRFQFIAPAEMQPRFETQIPLHHESGLIYAAGK